MSRPRRASRPAAPRPDRIWALPAQFAPIDRRLLLEGLLDHVTVETLALFVFLCLAADERGVSWYRRDTIARRTGLGWDEIGAAIERLEQLGWIAFQPWRPDAIEGVYQVLDLPAVEADAVLDDETEHDERRDA